MQGQPASSCFRWVDLTMSNPAIDRYARRDPMLRPRGTGRERRTTVDRDDLANPLASPINDSLAGLGPLSIYQGGNEILAAGRRAGSWNKAKAAGTTVHYWFSPHAFHDFVALTTGFRSRMPHWTMWRCG